MKTRLLLLVFLLLPLSANAYFYRKGTIVRMAVVSCTGAEHKGIMDVIGGGGPGGGGGLEGICREFTMKTDTVVYRLRTRKELLLPLGEDIEFRISRKELFVKQDDGTEEMKFTVLSMKLISEADEADQRAVRQYAPHCVTMKGKPVACPVVPTRSVDDDDAEE